MKWWIEHRRPGKPSEFHIVNTPAPSEPGFYRQVVSIDSFRSRELSRRFPFDAQGRPLYKSGRGMPIQSCSVKRWDDHLYDLKTEQRMRNMGISVPETVAIAEHNSAWAFYKAVGYDYKKQRYTGAPT